MAEDQVSPKAEIVIIRRRGGDDLTAAKGGAWKIAYADFVTAMMAFFLVMWLINAANEATRAQVASYFNPIKLTDSSTGGKGLNDPKDVKKKQTQPENGGEAKVTEAEKATEEKVLSNPVDLLDKIAGQTAAKTALEISQATEKSKVITDPFDPMAWLTPADKALKTESAAKAVEAKVANHADEPQKKVAAGRNDQDSLEAGGKQSPSDAAPKQRLAENAEINSRPEAADEATHTRLGDGEKASDLAKAEKMKRALEIKKEVLSALNLQPEQLPANLDVEGTDEGLLISLTDKTDYGMFTVGSAEPNPKLIEIVAVIAGVLRKHPGFIVIRGHTDARPYRNKKYDNWQLSTARAHMAYYMLVRGGLDESRIRRVEGLADRDPKLPDHPEAAENRRIDILLGQDS